MTRRAWFLLLVLAALWGASYLFIAIALDDLSPAAIVASRCALAALVLAPIAWRTGAFAGLRPMVGPIVVLAAVQVAAPFLLISVGQTEIPSSLAGILVSTAPIFTVLMAVWVDDSERLQGRGLAGVAVGILGVGLLLGVDLGDSTAQLLGGLAVVLACVGYAAGGFMLKRQFRGLRPLGIVVGTMAATALMTLPLAIATPPAAVGLDTVGAIAALGAGGTGIAFVIYYTLNADIGPTRTSLVAYIAPVFSVLYGVTLLDEPFGPGTAVGLLLILGGSWMAGNSRRPSPAPTPAWSPGPPAAVSLRER